jgi:hypothetical protein
MRSCTSRSAAPPAGDRLGLPAIIPDAGYVAERDLPSLRRVRQRSAEIPARSRCSPWPIGGCTAKDCDLQGSIDGAESSVLSGAKAYRETLLARANLAY